MGMNLVSKNPDTAMNKRKIKVDTLRILVNFMLDIFYNIDNFIFINCSC